MLHKFSPLLLLAFLASCGVTIASQKTVNALLVGNPPVRAQAHSGAEAAFVTSFLNALQPRSFAESREYCGYIGLNSAGAYVATPAVRGDEASCTLPDASPKIRLLASYHTHGAYSPKFDNEVPSYEDLEGDILDQLDGYVSTPGGRIWYNVAATGRATLLCGLNCVARDSNFTPDPDFPVGKHYTVAQLHARQK